MGDLGATEGSNLIPSKLFVIVVVVVI